MDLVSQRHAEQFALPPEMEANSIGKHVDATEARIAEIIVASEECILVLRERRSALISAAVTGQIDVRDTNSLEADLAETAVDIAAGRYVQESAAAHVSRVPALARADDVTPPSC